MTSSMGTLDIARALQIALSRNIGVLSVLGKPPRLYDNPPEDPVFPYLTYGPMRTQDISGDEVVLKNHTLTLDIWSRYGGRAEALTILQAVYSAIENAAFDLGAVHLVRKQILNTDIFRAPDGQTIHGLIRLSLITDNTTVN